MPSGIRREIRGMPASMLWSVLFSATLVGVMFATEMGRIYRSQPPRSTRSAAPTFGASPLSEGGHGRHADTPWQIPLGGWKDILWRTYEQIGEDRLLAVYRLRGNPPIYARVYPSREEARSPMLTAYPTAHGGKSSFGTSECTWIDLLNPTNEETARVESALHIELPSREDLNEIKIIESNF